MCGIPEAPFHGVAEGVWIQYGHDVAAREPIALNCRYRDGDGGARTFQIALNGHIIALERFSKVQS